MTKHQLAEWLHDNYEQLAEAENWHTQEITRVKFEDLPSENKSTMLALADRMLNTFDFISSNTILDDSLPCTHMYSRAMNQPYPRKCVKCGEVEKEK